MLHGMGGRGGGRAAGVVLVAVLGLTGCDGGVLSTKGSSAEPGPSGVSEDGDLEVSDEQVDEALLAMDDALQSGDVEAYLAFVGPELQDQQRAWFDGVRTAPLEMRELRLDGVVSRTPSEGTVAHVGLRHQFTGADPVPVLQQYRWVFAAADDGAPLLVASDGRNGEFFGHPQLWDLGEELVVLTGHSVQVLAQQSRAGDAESLLDPLDRAAEASLATLPPVAEGRERLVVQMVPGETVIEHGWSQSPGSASMLKVSPDPLPREPGRLTGFRTPVQSHLFLDLDLALDDLQEYGQSPGGQTELRYFAAYAALWGEDPDTWPEDWVLEGMAYWWSSVDDPAYSAGFLSEVGDHFAVTGPPTALPALPRDPDDLDGFESYVQESVALAYYVEETYGQEALIDLAGRLTDLDQRHDEDQIEQAYRDTIGVDRDELLDGFARWTQTSPALDVEAQQSLSG